MLLDLLTLHSLACHAMLRELLNALGISLGVSAAAHQPYPFSRLEHAAWLPGLAWKGHSHMTCAGIIGE